MNQGFDEDRWLEFLRSSIPNTAIAFLGIEVVAVAAETVILRMPITDKTRQPLGLLHGGINMLLAETAASVHASWGVDLTRVVPVGIEISGSHVRSAKEGWVRAEGRQIRRTTQLAVHQVDILHEERNILLSTARVTNLYKSLSGEGG